MNVAPQKFVETPSIRKIGGGFDVSHLENQLSKHSELWDQHCMRTLSYESPHNKVSDIWVRYNAWSNYNGNIYHFHGPHKSEWYPCIHVIPEAWVLSRRVMRFVGGKKLGGVLITRIPPGGKVLPHVDRGWHASEYEKFAIQVKGNKDQAFCFEDAELRPEPGDLYTFDNSKLHWVNNDSDVERITLIICLKRST